MRDESDKILRLCSFYVSDWHLVTMLLPYISKKIDEEIKIATILEKDLKNNIETLVKKLNIKNEKEVLKINWNNKGENNNLNKILNENKDLIILVNGKKNFIDKANKKIDKFLEKNEEKIKDINIKIINCYEIVEFNANIIDILDNHDLILNTSGEREITDIFEDYIRKEKTG